MPVIIKKCEFYTKKTNFIGFIIVGNKGKWLLFEVSCLYARQVAVTCRRGTSMVRNLKFLTPFSVFLTINLFNYHCNLLK